MTIQEAIDRHGARTVYLTACRYGKGDTDGLARLGLSADTVAELWAILALAYSQISS